MPSSRASVIGLSARWAAEMKTPVAWTGVAAPTASVGGRGVDLAFDLGLARDHGLALEAVQRLGQLEVFGAAEFRWRLQGCRLALVFLEALARFVAGLLAGHVLLLGALAALQMLLEIGLAHAQRREQIAFGGFVEHDVGDDA